MDTKRVRRALLDRTVLLLFAVLFVPMFAGIELFPLVPSSVGSVVQPVLLLLSIPGMFVTIVGGFLYTSLLLTVNLPDVIATAVLFYLFAVVAAGIGRVLGRYASELASAMRLRYLCAGALVLAGVLASGSSPRFRPRVIHLETARSPVGRIGCLCSRSVADCVRPASVSSAWKRPFVGCVPGRRSGMSHDSDCVHVRTGDCPDRSIRDRSEKSNDTCINTRRDLYIILSCLNSFCVITERPL